MWGILTGSLNGSASTAKTTPSNGAIVVASQLQSKNNSSNDERMEMWIALGFDFLKFSISLGVTLFVAYRGYGLVSKMIGMMNSDTGKEKEIKKALAKRLKRPDVEYMSFDSYEVRLMPHVLGSEEITVSFSDVGGLEAEVEDVFDSIVFPIQLWNHRSQQQQVQGGQRKGKGKQDEVGEDDISVCPSGVLLYGAPGTGKTLIAKAIARESGATFLNIKASSLTDKWFGESDRLVSALFSLARKLGPSIVFIDEIETLLRRRDGSLTNPALTTLQGVFLAEWDGLVAERDEKNDNRESPSPPPPPPLPHAAERGGEGDLSGRRVLPPVVVLGATNRPNDIDSAFLRRMPVQVRTHMPTAPQRLSILRAMLREEKVDEESGLSLEEIAEETEGFSGSDLRELVRIACLQRMNQVKQAFRETFRSSSSSSSQKNNNTKKSDLYAQAAMEKAVSSYQETLSRPLNASDFLFALEKTRQTVRNTRQFNQEVFLNDQEKRQHRQGGGGRDLVEDVKALASVLSSLSSETKSM